MSDTISELFELVADLMDRDAFDSKIKARYEEYDGLLDEEALAYLIVDELGRNFQKNKSISELKNNDTVNLVVEVEDTGEPRTFSRKNKSVGQVVNIMVTEGTARCKLTLWDKDVEAVKCGKIKKGSRIRIINGYVKVSDFGTEINIGRWGLFLID